jgi:hypothetical protein
MPAVVKDANADQLVRVVNEQSEKVRSFKATVTMQLTVGSGYGARAGIVSVCTTDRLRSGKRWNNLHFADPVAK